MKNKILVSVLSVLLISVFSASVFSEDTVIRIKPLSAAQADVEDIFSVDIVIENGQNVTGCQVWLTYNPTVFEYADFQKGRFFPADAFYGKIWFDELSSTEARLRFAVTPISPSQHSGDGTIITLFFKVLAVNPLSLLNLVEGDLSGGTGTLLTGVDRKLLLPHVDDHGNTWADATVLLVDESLPGVIETENDVDYFSVEVPSSGELRLYTFLGRDTVIELRDSTGSVLPVDYDIEYGLEALRLRHNVSEGTYYIKVTGPNENSTKIFYWLRAHFTPEFDDGNTRGKATQLHLPLSSPRAGWIGPADVDYFYVDVSGPGRLSFYTTGNLDTVIELQDKTGATIELQNSTGAVLTSDGIYYIKVAGVLAGKSGDYTLHASFTPTETVHLDKHWLWMMVPTETGKGGAASINIDSLCKESGGAVTETWVASHGANQGDAVGDYKWTYEEIGDDDLIIGNINQTLIDVGWADENEDVNDHSVYALVKVTLDQKITRPLRVPMHVGGDDALKVWLNGEIVYSQETDRASSGYQDTFNVDLNPGSNLLMVKVSERTGAWRMFVGFDVPDAETKEDIDVGWPLNDVAPTSHRPLVRVIYYYPKDQTFDKTDVSYTRLKERLMGVQRLFADEMDDKGYGRKTFQYESDNAGDPVVHGIMSKHNKQVLSNRWGKFGSDHCEEENDKNNIQVNFCFDVREDIRVQWDNLHGQGTFESSNDVYLIIQPDDAFVHSPFGFVGMAFVAQSESKQIFAHELGHALGLVHDFRDGGYVMSYGDCLTRTISDVSSLSPSSAHWLDVHSAFNEDRCSVDSPTAINSIKADKSSLKVKVDDADGLHQIRLIVYKKVRPSTEASNMSVLTRWWNDCGDPEIEDWVFFDHKQLDCVTNETVEFNIEEMVENKNSIKIQFRFIDVNGNITAKGPFELKKDVDGNITVEAPSTPEKPEAPKAPIQVSLLSKETALFANYPNPFNPETWIPYQLAEPADVTLTIYDIQGRVVRDLDLGHQRVGIYQSRARAAHWDGRNALGEPVASGLYFYTLKAGDFTATRKMLIRK